MWQKVVHLEIFSVTHTHTHRYKGHAHKQFGLQSCLTYNDAYIMSGSEDGLVFVWDLVTGASTPLKGGHKSAVCGVAAHPKSNLLLSCSNDRTAVLWASS